MGAPESSYDLDRTKGRVLWMLGIALVVLIGVLVASDRGFTFGLFGDSGPTIEVPPGGLAAGVSEESVKAAQPEFQDDIAEANEQLGAQPAATDAAAIELNGQWRGMNGATYTIAQTGAAATIVEFDGFGNATALGDGTITGRSFAFVYETAAFDIGVGELTLSSDGRSLTGTFSDSFGTRPASMSR